MRMPEIGSQGFTLIEVMAAVMIISMAVVGGMAVLSATVRSANRSEGNVELIQLVRSQIETIKQFEFQTDPAGYPTIEGLPEGATVTIDVEDPGTSYIRPQPSGGVINGVMQKITVTAAFLGNEEGGEANAETSITFYKLDTR